MRISAPPTNQRETAAVTGMSSENTAPFDFAELLSGIGAQSVARQGQQTANTHPGTFPEVGKPVFGTNGTPTLKESGDGNQQALALSQNEIHGASAAISTSNSPKSKSGSMPAATKSAKQALHDIAAPLHTAPITPLAANPSLSTTLPVAPGSGTEPTISSLLAPASVRIDPPAPAEVALNVGTPDVLPSGILQNAQMQLGLVDLAGDDAGALKDVGDAAASIPSPSEENPTNIPSAFDINSIAALMQEGGALSPQPADVAVAPRTPQAAEPTAKAKANASSARPMQLPAIAGIPKASNVAAAEPSALPLETGPEKSAAAPPSSSQNGPSVPDRTGGSHANKVAGGPQPMVSGVPAALPLQAAQPGTPNPGVTAATPDLAAAGKVKAVPAAVPAPENTAVILGASATSPTLVPFAERSPGQAGSQGTLMSPNEAATGQSATSLSAGTAEPANLQGITNARLVQSMSGSEMQVNLHSEDFGRVSVHTAFGRESIATQISLENSQLGSALGAALTSHASSIEQRLGQDHGLRASVTVETHTGADTASSNQQRDGSEQGRSRSNLNPLVPNAVLRGSPESPTHRPVTPPSETGRLDVRI